MPTAWEILKSNSTLQSGTAWEHLNNQAGGGAGDVLIGWSFDVSFDGGHITADMAEGTMTASIIDSDGVTMSGNMDANINNEILKTG